MEAGAQTGFARVRINASSGGEDAHYEVELNVRNPNPFITNVIRKEVSPGERVETLFEALGEPGNREGYLEVSSIPAINLSGRSEEHTSELQSLMRISYAVFCLNKKNKHKNITCATRIATIPTLPSRP